MISAGQAKPDTSKAVTIPTQLTMSELAGVLDLSRVAIVKRADKENWPFDEIPVRGGLQKSFPLRTLPLDIQRKVRIHFGELPAELAECVPLDFDAARAARCATTWDAALQWQRDLARKRLDVLNAWTAFRAGFKGTMKAADSRFLEMFGQRVAPGIDPQIYDSVRKLKRSALHEWQQRFASQGIAGLISKHGHNRGQTKIPLEQQHHILGTFKANPNLKPGKIAKALRHTFNGEAVNTRSVRLFLRQQAKLNPQVYTFLRSPDAWKSKHQLALGSASEKATHFLHYVEVDSTVADVVCDDGKRYNICGLIDIFSRKCKFLVTQTSSSWAIAGLLRNTIMDWGIPENIVRDNGKDYGSQMITDACKALDINEVILPPFTPEGKPHIERVFGTLTRDLFETLPGYCGHNVADQQAIRSRQSFAERYGKKNPPVSPFKKGGEKGNTISEGDISLPPFSKGGPGGIFAGLTPQELQEAIDRWTEQVYHHRVHGSLRVSPNTKAASVGVRPRRIEDPRSLDILLAPAPKGGMRVVLKEGIHLDCQLYWHDELIDWIGRKVRVKLDMSDAGRIFCFDPDFRPIRVPDESPVGAGFKPARGQVADLPLQDGGRQTAFICEALDLSISGLTVGDMIAARKRAKKRMLEGVKAMKALAAEVGDPLAEEIRQIREERATVTNLRVGEPIIDNPFVDAANKAASALEEKRAEKDRGNPFLQKVFPPDPLPKNSQLFDATDEDQKILRFVTKAEEGEPRFYFKNYRERFEWLKEAQRHRELASDEIRWLLTYIDKWIEYAEMFSEKWPEADRLWLGTLAPDHFPQYVVREDSK